jgi:formylglycine-generating enzyme required for sulfatase activity
MDVSPRHLLGFEINDRLRLIELVEERPFAYFFKGEVLALSRVVGTCSVTVYRPSARSNINDLVEAIRSASKNLQGEFIYGVQQVDQIRHGDPAGFVYVTGEPVLTTLSLEIAQSRFLGYEDGERIICNVARGLMAYHDENLTHGRIRPYHIVKTSDGWKLAGHEMIELEERLDRLVRLPEEPVYLPPENYRKGLYSTMVDLWALGVCMHQASCGRLPYADEGDLIEQILKNAPRVEKPPGRFGSVVRALLSQDPEERWNLRRCIDHIERPRDNDFAGAGAVQQATRLAAAEEAQRVLAAAPNRVRGPRPLYLRFGFLLVCILAFGAGALLGWDTARLPPVPRHNAPPEPLYSVDFQHAQVDADGRLVTRTPQQTVAYAEELGQGNRLEMLQIRPGAFQMGSTVNEPYGEASERPLRRVQVSGFFLSRFEITQQQWAAVAASPKVSVDLHARPSSFKGEDRPVEGVTWVEAKEFCARLSRVTGRLYRLPTEAEWEFACRGGTETPFCFGQTIISSLANYQADRPYSSEGVGEYRRQTISVGSLSAANYFGLSDMHGNVAEWCEDIYGDYAAGDQTDPTGPASGRDRVVRGGGWRSYPWQCRSASRVGLHESLHRNDIGFRVVLPEVVMVENPKN